MTCTGEIDENSSRRSRDPVTVISSTSRETRLLYFYIAEPPSPQIPVHVRNWPRRRRQEKCLSACSAHCRGISTECGFFANSKLF
jgi:hypothetical protein